MDNSRVASVLYEHFDFETDVNLLEGADPNRQYLVLMNYPDVTVWRVMELITHYCPYTKREETSWVDSSSYDDFSLGCEYDHINLKDIAAFIELPRRKEILEKGNKSGKDIPKE